MERSPHKQIIIVRKDLNMSPGKLAAQVSHGSMAFLTTAIRKSTYKVLHSEHKEHFYVSELHIPADNYEILWVCAGGEIVYLEGDVTIPYVREEVRA